MTEELHIDKKIYDLYDEYCHTEMDRRTFLQRASAMTIAGVSGLAMAQALLPRYAVAQTVSFTDERIKAKYVDYPSEGGTSGEMRGYLVSPSTDGTQARHAEQRRVFEKSRKLQWKTRCYRVLLGWWNNLFPFS